MEGEMKGFLMVGMILMAGVANCGSMWDPIAKWSTSAGVSNWRLPENLPSANVVVPAATLFTLGYLGRDSVKHAYQRARELIDFYQLGNIGIFKKQALMEYDRNQINFEKEMITVNFSLASMVKDIFDFLSSQIETLEGRKKTESFIAGPKINEEIEKRKAEMTQLKRVIEVRRARFLHDLNKLINLVNGCKQQGDFSSLMNIIP